MMNRWNSLQQTVVRSGSLSAFNGEIDRFLISKGIKSYEERQESAVQKYHVRHKIRKWRSRLNGLDDPFLLLMLMVLIRDCKADLSEVCQVIMHGSPLGSEL
eukprot:g16517.t1